VVRCRPRSTATTADDVVNRNSLSAFSSNTGAHPRRRHGGSPVALAGCTTGAELPPHSLNLCNAPLVSGALHLAKQSLHKVIVSTYWFVVYRDHLLGGVAMCDADGAASPESAVGRTVAAPITCCIVAWRHKDRSITIPLLSLVSVSRRKLARDRKVFPHRVSLRTGGDLT
jgi:hypothetical protein